MEGHLEKLRRAEIDRVKSWFIPGIKVLEIGGGSGYQASIIASWGCEVVSVDLADRPESRLRYHTVQNYDGQYLPFDSESFDIVFSSNVLEHIKLLPTVFAEIHRVLKPKGLAIHILPTPTWRFWTSLSHYVYLIEYLSGRKRTIQGVANTPSARSTLSQKGVTYLIKRALLAGPHGEYPSALSELYFFSKRRWLAVFHENNFEIDQVTEGELFYTGYSIFPNISLKVRHQMTHFLGSACRIYVMHSKKD